MVLKTDSRVLTLVVELMVDALGNPVPIIVLPIYIASGQISLSGIADTEVDGSVF
jgi:hypothetical protein